MGAIRRRAGHELRRRSKARLLYVPALVVILSQMPLTAFGQVVVGTIQEWESAQKVEYCLVALLDDSEEEIARAYTNGQGAFTLSPPSPGIYVVSIVRIGFHPSAEGPVSVLANDTVTVEYEIRPVAVTLAPIVVKTARVIRYLENAGFYQRQRNEHGFFLDPAEIEKRMHRATRVTDLLHGIPGLAVTGAPDGQFGTTVRVRGIRTLGGRCEAPLIYIDGRLAYEPKWDQFLSLDELVNREAVSAVEVYRGPAEVPARYGGAESACGVLLIWTGHRD